MSTPALHIPTPISAEEALALRSLRSRGADVDDALSAGEHLEAVRHICVADGPYLRLDLAVPGLRMRHDLYLSRDGLARISSSHDDAEVAVAPVPLLPGILARLSGLAPTAAPRPDGSLPQVPAVDLDAVFDAAPARFARDGGDTRDAGTLPAPLRRLFRLRRDPEGAGPTVIGGIIDTTSLLLMEDALRPVSSTELFRAVFTAARPTRSS